MFTSFKLVRGGSGGEGSEGEGMGGEGRGERSSGCSQREHHGNTAGCVYLVGVSRDQDVHIKLSLGLKEHTWMEGIPTQHHTHIM